MILSIKEHYNAAPWSKFSKKSKRFLWILNFPWVEKESFFGPFPNKLKLSLLQNRIRGWVQIFTGKSYAQFMCTLIQNWIRDWVQIFTRKCGTVKWTKIYFKTICPLPQIWHWNNKGFKCLNFREHRQL